MGQARDARPQSEPGPPPILVQARFAGIACELWAACNRCGALYQAEPLRGWAIPCVFCTQGVVNGPPPEGSKR